MPKLLRILALLWIALMLGFNLFYATSKLTLRITWTGVNSGGTIYEEWYEIGWPAQLIEVRKDQATQDFNASIDSSFGLAIAFDLIVWAILPIVFWLTANRLIKRTRIAKGLCHRCGYNLDGSVSDQCPECGTDIYMLTTLKKPTD
ncbi:MAG: hypothetical protein AB8C95_02615 [Phycisphaeraceae bacterium]